MQFLREHPRTTEWRRQREQCLACAFCVDTGANGLRCADARSPRSVRAHGGAAAMLNARGIGTYCIDAREPGEQCGPDALHFKPRKAAK